MKNFTCLALFALLMGVVESSAADEAAIKIAIADFDYGDTSGEPRDQTAEHTARLKSFDEALRADLAASGYQPVSIACRSPPCTAGSMAPVTLIAAAKATGARLLLYGEVRKMSTLIQWGKAQVIDLQADRLVDDKMFTFRGDDDEAWRRAEKFLAQEIKEKTLGR